MMEDSTYLPEKALGLAIIQRAALDARGLTALGAHRGSTPETKYLIRQAKAWIFSAYDEKNRRPFSFPWWCDILEIDANSIRRFVLSGSGRATTNRTEDLDLYIRIYDDNTTEPYKLVI